MDIEPRAQTHWYGVLFSVFMADSADKFRGTLEPFVDSTPYLKAL